MGIVTLDTNLQLETHKEVAKARKLVPIDEPIKLWNSSLYVKLGKDNGVGKEMV